ncbi:hypothetical protein FG386_000588 [Cryptosporidium ryanae]|uniref:uncharacterized protein n=1 Tax=Cryptosporidium ryanae TaxID=515981 RepID=UPI00351A10FA|nr:hypothetical protein FG386_000588 [Cryptosporidium ryanae]
MGKQSNKEGINSYTFTDLFNHYSIDKIRELIDFMNKLINMETLQLETFIGLSMDQGKSNVENYRKTDKIKRKKIKIDENDKENQNFLDDSYFDLNNGYSDHDEVENIKESQIELPDELFASD